MNQSEVNFDQLRSEATEAQLIVLKDGNSRTDDLRLIEWRQSLTPELLLFLIREAEHPKLDHLTPEKLQAVAQIDRYAQRVLNQQDIAQGSVAMYNSPEGRHPIPPVHVAAVLHALADFTHNEHMVNTIVDQEVLARSESSRSFHPRVSSLGRYFHRLADAIEWREADRARKVD